MVDTIDVLHLNAGNLYGGIETYLVTVARKAKLCPQMRSRFALCFEGRLADELRQAGAQLRMLGETRVRAPWTLLRARRRLRQVLKQQRADVAVVHGSWAHAIFGNELARAEVPSAYFVHGVGDPGHWLNRWAARRAPARLLVNSDHTAKLFSLFPGTPSTTLYYPVAAPDVQLTPEASRELRAEHGADDDTVVVIQTSRMEASKGHKLHLQALARLQTQTPWQLWFAGGAQRLAERAYQAKLEQMVDAHDLGDRVRFLGQRQDVPRLLAASDIHCQPNAGPEPFGIVFIEGLYASLPVVTTDMGGGAEIVTPETGVLVPPGDVAALSQTLQRLIESPELRAELGARGPARARQLCDPQRQLNKLAEALSSIVAPRF